MTNRFLKIFRLLRSAPSTLAYPICKVMTAFQAGHRVRILTYHRIDYDSTDRLAVNPEDFARQMEFLKREGYKVISVNDVINNIQKGRHFETKTIAITFDDGYLDNYTYALPILQGHGLNATFFLATGFVDMNKTFSLTTTLNRPKPMSWQDVQTMVRYGMSMGAHTVNHAKLTQIPIAEAVDEIRQSRTILQEQTGKPVDIFCYPGGYFDEHVRQEVIQAGFRGACSVRPGTNTLASDRFNLRRTEISGDDTLFDFEKKVCGAFDLQHNIWQLLKKIARNIKEQTFGRQVPKHEATTHNAYAHKRRVMHLIEDLEYGGAERQLITIAKGTDLKKYKVQVCCLSHAGAMAMELEETGVAVHVLCKRGKFDIKILLKLVKLLKSQKIDVLHTHVFTASFWGRLASIFVPGLRIVQHEHSHFSLQSRIRWFLDRLMSIKSDMVIAVSAELERSSKRRMKNIRKKLQLVQNGSIAVDQLASVKSAATLRGTNGRYKTVAIIGSLEPRKDHDTFLRAAKIVRARNPKTRFLIVGDGPLRCKLETEAANLGLNGSVNFIGWQSDVLPVLKKSDVYVSSSTTEGTSVALLEAMAAGLPVVCTRVGGNPEIVEHGERGLLVPKRDSRALAEAISYVLENPETGYRLAENGRRYVFQHFSAKRMISQIEKIYDDVLK